MNEPRVILVNPDLTSAAAQQLLQGYSGKSYGVSRYSAAHNCHVVEMSLGDYEACWNDLWRGVHLLMRRWYPRFVAPEEPKAIVEFAKGYAAGLDAGEVPEDASLSFRAGWSAATLEKRPDLAASLPPVAPTEL
jgi:hypothetical protein